MSYRKKHYPPKPEKAVQQTAFVDMEYTNPGVERTIFSGKLTSGLPYQRQVNEKEVDRLIQEWDDRLLDPIIVSFRDGRFYVVDGQHRISAMRKMNGGREVMVVCKVCSGLTYEQEADLCFKLDKAKRRLSLSQSTNALAESGTDAEVAEIRRLVELAGFHWALGKKSGREYEIIATRAIFNSYRLLGGPDFSRMLGLLSHTWRGNPRSLTAALLSGMALFLKTYGTELDDNHFIRRLSVIDPDEIIRRGRLDYSTSNNSLRYARVLLEKYNGTRRTNKQLPYRFKG